MRQRGRIVENYIVRIYRFEKDNPRHLVGIVESVEGEGREKRAFTSFDDLWEILNSRLLETDIHQQRKPVRQVEGSEPPTPIDVMKGLKTKSDH